MALSEYAKLITKTVHSDPDEIKKIRKMLEAEDDDWNKIKDEFIDKDELKEKPKERDFNLYSKSKTIDKTPRDYRFMPTKLLFTSPPPPDSSEWSSSGKEGKIYKPLDEGWVGRSLVTSLNHGRHKNIFKPTGPHGAAKYSDFQFRIILRGLLKRNRLQVKAIIDNDGSVQFILEEADIYRPSSKGVSSPLGLGTKAVNIIGNTMREDIIKLREFHNFPKIKLEVDPSTFFEDVLYVDNVLSEAEEKNKILANDIQELAIKKLNPLLLKNWFGVDKIAATTSNRILDNALVKWMVVSDAKTRLNKVLDYNKKREKGFSYIEFLLELELIMDIEFWVDARILVSGRGFITGLAKAVWEFRAFGDPYPFLYERYSV